MQAIIRWKNGAEKGFKAIESYEAFFANIAGSAELRGFEGDENITADLPGKLLVVSFVEAKHGYPEEFVTDGSFVYLNDAGIVLSEILVEQPKPKKTAPKKRASSTKKKSTSSKSSTIKKATSKKSSAAKR